jgi:hypothetical protein
MWLSSCQDRATLPAQSQSAERYEADAQGLT